MIKNNIELDFKVKCIEEGITQAKIAEEINTTKSYVNQHNKKTGWSSKQDFCADDGSSWL